MLPGTYDLKIRQGVEWYITVNMPNEDLTGYSCLSQIRSKPGSGTVLATLTYELLSAAPSGSTFKLSLSAVQTLALAVSGSHQWDVRLSKTGAETLVPLSGSVTVAGAISRDP